MKKIVKVSLLTGVISLLAGVALVQGDGLDVSPMDLGNLIKRAAGLLRGLAKIV